MADIVTLDDLASFLRVQPSEVYGFQPHIDLAQGLIVEAIGDQASWPASAKTAALAALARAYYNPRGLRSQTQGPFTEVADAAALGIYLTDDELGRLHRSISSNGPRGSFPDAQCWPEPPLPRSPWR